MNLTEVDYIFKVLIIGNSSVGKSNILLRFSENIFHETFLPTIGVDFKVRNVSLGGKTIKLNIWDTAGQERFKTITAAYYKGSHGVVLVYDITDRESFNNIVSWMAEVKKHAGPNVARVLVGNKCDMTEERKVTEREAKEFADQQGMAFFETSAKAKINIDETFNAITKAMFEQLPEGERRPENQGVGLGAVRPSKKKEGCC